MHAHLEICARGSRVNESPQHQYWTSSAWHAPRNKQSCSRNPSRAWFEPGSDPGTDRACRRASGCKKTAAAPGSRLCAGPGDCDANCGSGMVPLYGEDMVKQQRPLQADLTASVWTVRGSPPPEQAAETLVAVISRIDGRILKVGTSVFRREFPGQQLP